MDEQGSMPERSDRTSHHPKKKHRYLILLAFLAVVAVVVVIVAASLPSLRSSGQTGDATQTTSPIRVTVPAGSSAVAIAKDLEEKGIVTSAKAFLDAVKAAGADTALRPGTYEFTPGEALEAIILKLRSGDQVDVQKLTIPEGLSIDQVAARLIDLDVADGEEYEKLAHDPKSFDIPMVGGEKLNPTTLEGILFPSTYFVDSTSTAHTLIQTQVDTFEGQTGDLPWDNTERLGITPYEALIVASLIEKETSVPEERPLAAAVVYNRLAKDMRLEFCSTVRFALKKWTGPLTNSDLEADSPYNTYRVNGLPPSPVASPGLDALKAALTPAEVDFLYFVLVDEEGHHLFTASYDEFLEAKATAKGQ